MNSDEMIEENGRKMLELNNIYNMDCLEGMKLMQQQGIKVDWVITDPPYGIGADKDLRANTQYGNAVAKSKEYGKKEWDKKPDKHYFDLMREISNQQIIFGGNYFADLLPPSSCWIVWDKETGDNGYADCELAWCSLNKAVRLYRYRWQGMLQGNMKMKEERIHPTQKPLPVIEWILNKFTKEGDTVLDPFMGSGTTAVACHKLKRNYIGFELDKEYYDLSMQRISDVRNQISVFDL